MSLLRSLIFNLCFWTYTTLVGLLFIPTYLGPVRVRRNAQIWWSRGSLFLMRHIMGITFRIEGRENLPEGACVLASKHQSAWETVAFAELFWPVLFVLKKELTYIPVFGWALSATKQIIIDRKAGTQAMRHLIREGQRARSDGARIPIFPEGTRVPVGTQPPLLPGVVALARHLGLPVIPVALNSGTFWPRSAFLKKPGVVVVRIFPALPKDIGKDEMLKILHQQINTPLDGV